MIILTRAPRVGVVVTVMHMLSPHVLPQSGGFVVEIGDAFIKLRHATPLRHITRRRRRRHGSGRKEPRPAKAPVSPRHSCSSEFFARLVHPRGAKMNCRKQNCNEGSQAELQQCLFSPNLANVRQISTLIFHGKNDTDSPCCVFFLMEKFRQILTLKK